MDSFGPKVERASRRKVGKLRESPPKDYVHKCRVCSKAFTDRGTLMVHIQIHSLDQYECTQCDYRSPVKKYLSRHVKLRHEDNKIYGCEICGLKFQWPSKLAHHLLVHTGEKPYSCDQCDKCFNTSYSLNTHKFIHMGLKPYKCEWCGFSCRDSSTLRKHRSRRHIHGMRYLQCDQCDYRVSSTSPHAMKVHIAEKHLHLDLVKHFCDKCGRGFKNPWTLAKHVRVVHERSEVTQCEICGKYIAHRSNMKAHLSTHRDYRPYKCRHEGCTKAFKDKYALSRHTATHTHPFHCHYCPRVFSRGCQLANHEARHWARGRRVECCYCGVRFLTKPSLRKHIKQNHLDEEGCDRLRCDECGFECRSRTNMEMHWTWRHLSGRRLKCNICDKRFRTERTFKKHNDTVHSKPVRTTDATAEESCFDMEAMVKEEPKDDEVSIDLFEVEKQEVLDDLNYEFNEMEKEQQPSIEEALRACEEREEREESEETREHDESEEREESVKTGEHDESEERKETMNHEESDKTGEHDDSGIREETEDHEESEEKIAPENEKPAPSQLLRYDNDDETNIMEEVEEKLGNIGFEENIEITVHGAERSTTDVIKKTDNTAKKKPYVVVPQRKVDKRASKKVKRIKEKSDRAIREMLAEVRRREAAKSLEETRRQYNERLAAILGAVEKAPTNKNSKTASQAKANDIIIINDDLNDKTKDVTLNKKGCNSTQELNGNPSNELTENVTIDGGIEGKHDDHTCCVCEKAHNTHKLLIDHCQEHFQKDPSLKTCPLCGYNTKYNIRRHMKFAHDLTIRVRYNIVNEGSESSQVNKTAKEAGKSHKDGNKDVSDNSKTSNKAIESNKDINRLVNTDKSNKDDEVVNAESRPVNNVAKQKVANEKVIEKAKLVKKGKEWIMAKEVVKVNTDYLLPELEIDVKINEKKLKIIEQAKDDSYMERLKRLYSVAKKNGKKMLFPCEKCEKICLNASALKLHLRKHDPDKKPFKKKVWKHKLKNKALKNKDKTESKKVSKKKNIVSDNRQAKPRPIRNNHKCDDELMDFYEKNIRGGDIEFWQFLKIYNRMGREDVKEFEDLEKRTDFGLHVKGTEESVENSVSGNSAKDSDKLKLLAEKLCKKVVLRLKRIDDEIS